MALLPRPASPLRAIADLRRFLARREPHQLVFAFLAIVLTGGVLAGFYVDSKFEKPWKRDVQYFESWPANRTDEEIRAQLVIDLAKQRELKAKNEKILEERRAPFKKMDKQLDDLGL